MTAKYTVKDFLAEVGNNEDKKEKLNLTFDEVHSLTVNSFSYSESEHGEYIQILTDDNIIFFSSYEMNSVKKAIGEAEAPFTLHILRQKKQSTKSDNIYNNVVCKMEAI